MNPFFQQVGIYSGVIALGIFLGGIVPMLRHWHRKYLPIVLSFAAGLMLGASFFHMLPESFEALGKTAGVYILAGFFFLFFVEKFITVHVCEIFDCEVHSLGITAFLGIGLHTIVNGLALGSSIMADQSTGINQMGLSVFLAIAVHKAPEVFSMTSVLMHSEAKRFWILIANLFVWAMIPLGAFIAYLFLGKESHLWIGRALAFSAGTFLHISLSDLLPEAHRHSPSKIFSSFIFLIGLGVMWLLTKKFQGH